MFSPSTPIIYIFNNTQDLNLWKIFLGDAEDRETIATGGVEPLIYEDETQYIGQYCLVPGEYRLRVQDKDESGVQHDPPSYEVTVDGTVVVQSDDDDVDWDMKVHQFTV